MVGIGLVTTTVITKIRRDRFPMRSVLFSCDPAHEREAWHMIFMCSREGLVGEPNWALPPSMRVGHQKYVVSTDRVKGGLWSFLGGFLKPKMGLTISLAYYRIGKETSTNMYVYIVENTP